MAPARKKSRPTTWGQSSFAATRRQSAYPSTGQQFTVCVLRDDQPLNYVSPGLGLLTSWQRVVDLCWRARVRIGRAHKEQACWRVVAYVDRRPTLAQPPLERESRGHTFEQACNLAERWIQELSQRD